MEMQTQRDLNFAEHMIISSSGSTDKFAVYAVIEYRWKKKWKQFDTEPYITKFKYIYVNMSECEAHRSKNLHAAQQ